MTANFDAALTPAEREWVAACISDASVCANVDDAARLIEARVENLIRRRLEPFADYAAEIVAYEADHAEGADTPVLLAVAGDLVTMLEEGNGAARSYLEASLLEVPAELPTGVTPDYPCPRVATPYDDAE